jgi:serine/arginine repetitive matrix protein 2
MIGEIIGEARPERTAVSEDEVESLPVARVELERRRIDRNGKVKQKLSCTGVAVNKCIVSPTCLPLYRFLSFSFSFCPSSPLCALLVGTNPSMT